MGKLRLELERDIRRAEQPQFNHGPFLGSLERAILKAIRENIFDAGYITVLEAAPAEVSSLNGTSRVRLRGLAAQSSDLKSLSDSIRIWNRNLRSLSSRTKGYHRG